MPKPDVVMIRVSIYSPEADEFTKELYEASINIEADPLRMRSKINKLIDDLIGCKLHILNELRNKQEV